MPVPLLQIDAFSNQPFGGNPAAVCLLERAADATWMQRVAAEMNLAETAFVVPGERAFGLRWFTPTVEVGLCGHATLASAHALWESGRVAPTKTIAFQTASGVLTAERDGDRIAISLPVRPVIEIDTPAGLIDALGATPKVVTSTVTGEGSTAHGNVLLEFADEATVRGLTPRFALLKDLPFGVIATARAARAPYDFVSRYFASPYGIDEDPVTGSAHCSLAPYWAGVLRKTRFVAWQASARGGELHVSLQGDRVRLAGYAVTVLKGELTA